MDRASAAAGIAASCYSLRRSPRRRSWSLYGRYYDGTYSCYAGVNYGGRRSIEWTLILRYHLGPEEELGGCVTRGRTGDPCTADSDDRLDRWAVSVG